MEIILAVVDWYKEALIERISLTLLVLNTIAQKTPWKGDDDFIAMLQEILTSVLGFRKSGKLKRS